MFIEQLVIEFTGNVVDLILGINFSDTRVIQSREYNIVMVSHIFRV